ncbi:hotdog family protein [Cupriavidus sp. BIS7]|uniref:hotdog family protein n=1 Tax=Cupriavidus sp. BIS7 TaxID=1217718 RepID=UPI0002F26C42|nr:hotdog family protein [Cupriavidus sp. BIS7]
MTAPEPLSKPRHRPDLLPPVAQVVPHAGAMRLIDELLEADDTACMARATVRPTQLFVDEAGMPAWIGIEYMAQTIAAWAGVQARGSGHGPRPGFLLGSRRYASDVAAFPVGSELTVRVQLEMAGDDGLSLFACTLAMDGCEVARATVSVFQPADAQALQQALQQADIKGQQT